MRNDPAIESAIQQYIDAAAESFADAPLKRRRALSRELREHIREAIRARTSGRPPTLQDVYATLAEMDSPEAYAETLTPRKGEREFSVKLLILAFLCCGLQIAGLGAAVAGIPVVGAVAGFAAVVNFFLVWSYGKCPKWVVRLAGVAAILGLGMIIIEIARSLA